MSFSIGCIDKRELDAWITREDDPEDFTDECVEVAAKNGVCLEAALECQGEHECEGCPYKKCANDDKRK